jgi:hypothetical protein
MGPLRFGTGYVAAPGARHLHLVDSDRARQGCQPENAWWPWGTEPRQRCSRVLLAGSDEAHRQKLRAELSRTLEPGTVFVEASEAWEVVQQAPGNRMVVLAGDLREASAESITRVLGRRYPGLPVLRLDEVPILDTAPDVPSIGSLGV